MGSSSSGCKKSSYVEPCACGYCSMEGLGERLEDKSLCIDEPADLTLSDAGSSGKRYQELGLQDNVCSSSGFSDSEDNGPTYVCKIYLPDPSTLVPALKGRRKKQASSRRVTWPPDVYDPIPTDELGGFQFFSMFSDPDS